MVEAIARRVVVAAELLDQRRTVDQLDQRGDQIDPFAVHIDAEMQFQPVDARAFDQFRFALDGPREIDDGFLEPGDLGFGSAFGASLRVAFRTGVASFATAASSAT